MSLEQYNKSKALLAALPGLDLETLLMATMRTGSGGVNIVKAGWPELYAEFIYRYWSAGGLLPGEDGYNADLDDNLRQKKLQAPSFTCPDCNYTSFNTHDIANSYCGNCHAYKEVR